VTKKPEPRRKKKSGDRHRKNARKEELQRNGKTSWSSGYMILKKPQSRYRPEQKKGSLENEGE